MKDIINDLQNKSYQTRVRIMWTIVILVAVGVGFLMVQSIKNSVDHAGGNLTRIEAAKFVAESLVPYVTIERVERTPQALKVFFNFNNKTPDILNVPKITDIIIKIEGNTFNPQKITDRQGNAFAKKILTNAQNFGILYFTPTEAKTSTLIFDEMFFEKKPTDVFRQTIELNLEAISKASHVRN